MQDIDEEWPLSPSSYSTQSSSLNSAFPLLQSSTAARTKTIYYIAHPSPSSQRRAKLLFQLQSSSQGARPLPAYNVFPASALGSVVSRALSKVRRGISAELKDDLVVICAEDYQVPHASSGSAESSNEDQCSWERTVGAICRTPEGPGSTRICLRNGQMWTASKLDNGNYELVLSGAEGYTQMARWRIVDTRSAQSRFQGHRYAFSLISPNRRLHPILAKLDSEKLSIWDQIQTSMIEDPLGESWADISDDVQSLIILSGTWVAAQEAGLLPSFSSSDLRTTSFRNSLQNNSQTSMSQTQIAQNGASATDILQDSRPAFRVRASSFITARVKVAGRGCPPVESPRITEFDKRAMLGRSFGHSRTVSETSMFQPAPKLDKPSHTRGSSVQHDGNDELMEALADAAGTDQPAHDFYVDRSTACRDEVTLPVRTSKERRLRRWLLDRVRRMKQAVRRRMSRNN